MRPRPICAWSCDMLLVRQIRPEMISDFNNSFSLKELSTEIRLLARNACGWSYKSIHPTFQLSRILLYVIMYIMWYTDAQDNGKVFWDGCQQDEGVAVFFSIQNLL